MQAVNITESTLAQISNATRAVCSVPSLNIPVSGYRMRSIVENAYDLESLDTIHMWDWAVNDGGTYLHLFVADPKYLDVTIFVKVIGTLDWGDGSLVETCNDSAVSYHTHTYSLTGQYVIRLFGTIVLGTSSHFMSGSNAMVSRYLQKIEIGANTTFSSGGLNTPNAWYIYFSDKSSGNSGYEWRYSPIRFLYLNKITLTIGGNAFAAQYGLQIRSVYGDGLLKMNGTHAFRGTTLFTMDKVQVDLASNSSNSRYFNYGDQLCNRLHFKNPLGTSQAMPNYVTGSYYYLNFPSNLTAFNDSTSSCTILSEGELHCQATTPPTLRSGSITCQTGAKIYVPVGCLETYQNASHWSALADYIQEEPS